MIRVVLVEDSVVQRDLLVALIERESDMTVIGAAADGERGIDLVRRLSPDVVLMDIHMPRLDGIKATRRIMSECPTPVVVMSATHAPSDVDVTFQAIGAGALAMIAKPHHPGAPEFEGDTVELVRALRLMAEVRVVRRRYREQLLPDTPSVAPLRLPGQRTRIVAIGGSTGAPGVLAEILSVAGSDIAVPLLIVQHLSRGFVQGLAGWLDRVGGPRVRIATQGERALPGYAYLAPDQTHLGIDHSGCLLLDGHTPDENGFRPSVGYLFRSVASAYGAAGAGILLSGLGTDGAEGLAQIQAAGGLTAAQDMPSCVVFGMPGAAIRLGAVQHSLDPPGLGRLLRALNTDLIGEDAS
ncbi:MAG: chemotaxis protein CheB [Pseudomonadota bacterium]|nr:chemotaxis protein CheB [Pseudomonadota bacterium]